MTYKPELTDALNAVRKYKYPAEWADSGGQADHTVSAEGNKLVIRYDLKTNGRYVGDMQHHAVFFVDMARALKKQDFPVAANVLVGEEKKPLNDELLLESYKEEGHRYWNNLRDKNGILEVRVPNTLESVQAVKGWLREEIKQKSGTSFDKTIENVRTTSKLLGDREGDLLFNELLANQGLAVTPKSVKR